MSFLEPLLSRLRRRRGPSDADMRPLWHQVVAIAREKHWYAQDGIADTLGGRFDAITLVLSLVLLRMEQEEALAGAAVVLTELFVTDMDGQLRESGVGDLVVGKHIGRLMSTLGGRIGAYRTGLADPDQAALTSAVARNVSLVDGAGPVRVATAIRELAAELAALTAQRLLAGDIPR